ncbi:T9SS type A sorting domain-containing protein [Hymenobacter sp. 102]|uniref:T9SS type A sorting domain-containing protein n=1 Tax=Hymenobacter sp. 102 TaxID=3403152 RepID=UPI003CF933F1
MDLGSWRLLYAGLHASVYNANVTLPPLPAANQALADARQPGRVGLALLLARYQTIRSDAATLNLLRVQNNQLYDVPGRTQSPYLTRTAVAVAPTEALITTRTPTFWPGAALRFTNAAPTIQRLEADFGDGQGYRTLAWDQAVPVSYAANGTKTLQFRLTCADGSVLLSHSQLVVNEPPAARYPAQALTRPTSELFMDVRPYNGRAASAQVTVALATNNATGQIRKPLIVVEGYDAGKFVDGADFTYRDFVTGDIFGGILTPYFRTIPGDRDNFNDQLSEVGSYDLVFVDFDEGTDYIQRNAFLVERIIQWVNERKQPLAGVRQQNVVVGMSMGGLVARYALRDMEVRLANGTSTVPHDTRLYISHEAPHQGANVPLSVQYMVRGVASIVLVPTIYFNTGTLYSGLNVGDLNTPLKGFRDLLNQPATQQLLLVQASAAGQAVHDAWLQEYNQLGYPQQCRSVATSNGSECATPQPYPPYAELLRLQGSGYLSKQLNQTIRIATIMAGNTLGIAVSLLGGGPLGYAVVSGAFALFSLGNYNGEVDFVLRALPSQQQQNIYRARLYLRKRVLGINIRVKQYTEDQNSQASMLAWDTAPGGQYDINAFAGGLLDQVRGNFPIPLAQYTVQPTFCFVPTVSALDIGSNAVAQTPQSLTASYSPSAPPTAPYNTPFANFVTAGRGLEGHIQWTGLNSKWAYNEMEQTPTTVNCLAFCQAQPTISGANEVCSSTTYSIAGLPPGVTVQWSAQPFGVLTSSFSTGPTFTATRNSDGAVVLQATLISECGRVTLNRRVTVGAPAEFELDGPTELTDCDPAGTYQITPFDPSLQYTITSSGRVRHRTLQPDGSFLVFAQATGTGEVRVTAANACGTRLTSLRINVTSCGYTYYTVYPNPAQDEATVQATDAEATAARSAPAGQPAEAPEFEVTLYNGQGQVVYQGRSQGRRARLPLRQLPAGLYQLHAGQGAQQERHTLQVTH